MTLSHCITIYVMQTHRAVWQTWALHKLAHTEPSNVEDVEQVEFRSRVQKARVERCMTIAALSEKLQCDAASLSAFERGDEVLDRQIQTRLIALFQL